jgi:16S rRNA (cytidine1402-2'-O)-methyltransferase
MLYVIATPIGNLEDITYRAVRVLGEVDVLAAEDTRRTRILFEKFNIPSPKKIISYREQNEKTAGDGLLKLLMEGKSVALCSDAGYPGLSDPGYRLISAAIEKGIEVVVIPGAGAISTSILSSGLPSDSFTFKGFPPKKSGARTRWLEMDRDLPHTLVIFESPMRVVKLLDSALEVLGDRKSSVCIELTKKFEEIHRGFISELAENLRDVKIKGEVTIVIAGNNPKFLKGSPQADCES